MLVEIGLSFILATILAILLILSIDIFVMSPGYKGNKTDYFDGKHFSNIGWTKRESYRVESSTGSSGKMIAFFRWVLSRKKPKWQTRSIEKVIPIRENPDNTFRITFIGHATILIQIGGINIITDPVWAERVSPFTHIGPRRFVDMGIELENLPKIDIILLSHNHYDHMDIRTLQRLNDRDHPFLYTGLGNSAYLQKYHIENTKDMDWWDVQQYKKGGSQDLTLTFVPAQHFSSRGIRDRNTTLWGGFVITILGKTLYFAGDTGYGEFVDVLKERFPLGFDVGLLPIGAYKPRWFMADIHTNPEEALMMQKKLSIKTGIGIHWGTFPLADDGQDDPLIDLGMAQEKPEFEWLDFRVGPNGSLWIL